MKIDVIVTGNRSLYRSIYESIDRTTHHRTATGAARAILKVESDAKNWARSYGHWGSYTIEIDGKPISSHDDAGLFATIYGAIRDRTWTCPVRAIAREIEDIYCGQSSE